MIGQVVLTKKLIVATCIAGTLAQIEIGGAFGVLVQSGSFGLVAFMLCWMLTKQWPRQMDEHKADREAFMKALEAFRTARHELKNQQQGLQSQIDENHSQIEDLKRSIGQ